MLRPSNLLVTDFCDQLEERLGSEWRGSHGQFVKDTPDGPESCNLDALSHLTRFVWSTSVLNVLKGNV